MGWWLCLSQPAETVSEMAVRLLLGVVNTSYHVLFFDLKWCYCAVRVLLNRRVVLSLLNDSRSPGTRLPNSIHFHMVHMVLIGLIVLNAVLRFTSKVSDVGVIFTPEETTPCTVCFHSSWLFCSARAQ